MKIKLKKINKNKSIPLWKIFPSIKRSQFYLKKNVIQKWSLNIKIDIISNFIWQIFEHISLLLFCDKKKVALE